MKAKELFLFSFALCVAQASILERKQTLLAFDTHLLSKIWHCKRKGWENK